MSNDHERFSFIRDAGGNWLHGSDENDLPIKELVEEAISFGTSLAEAELEDAFLVDLRGERAELPGANLKFARLDGANLDDANLERADLYKANLDGARLTGANLRGADLRGASFEGTIIDETTHFDGARVDPGALVHCLVGSAEVK